MKCFYCERETFPASMLPGTREAQVATGTVRTRDHKRPRLLGGGLARDNVVIACSRCNGLRGHLPFETFYAFAIAVIRMHPTAGQTSLRIALAHFVNDLLYSAMRDPEAVSRAVESARLNGIRRAA